MAVSASLSNLRQCFSWCFIVAELIRSDNNQSLFCKSALVPDLTARSCSFNLLNRVIVNSGAQSPPKPQPHSAAIRVALWPHLPRFPFSHMRESSLEAGQRTYQIFSCLVDAVEISSVVHSLISLPKYFSRITEGDHRAGTINLITNSHAQVRLRVHRIVILLERVILRTPSSSVTIIYHVQ